MLGELFACITLLNANHAIRRKFRFLVDSNSAHAHKQLHGSNYIPGDQNFELMCFARNKQKESGNANEPKHQEVFCLKITNLEQRGNENTLSKTHAVFETFNPVFAH